MDIHSTPISGACLLQDPEKAVPRPPTDTAYLVVTQEQYGQYMNGQAIQPIKVVMPKPTGELLVPAAAFDQERADKLLFNRVHDYIMSFVPMSDARKDDIMRAADFSSSDHVSEDSLLVIRGAFGYMLLCNILTTYWLNSDGIMHMWYFFTYWGILATLVAIIMAQKAVADKNRFQPTAILFAEMACGFNLVIFPLFWLLLARKLFNNPWDSLIHIVTNIHLIGSHTIPLIGGFTNVYLTKGHVMLPYDWRYVFFLGVSYIAANYIGTLEEGAPMYPVADWKNFFFTFFCYFALAAIEAGFYYKFSQWLCKKRGFTPTPQQ